MPAMDANETPPIADDRRRPALLTGLALAGSALLLAACSTLEPVANGPALPAVAGTAGAAGSATTATGHRSADGRTGSRSLREATRLPDQADGDGVDADRDPAGASNRPRAAVPAGSAKGRRPQRMPVRGHAEPDAPERRASVDSRARQVSEASEPPQGASLALAHTSKAADIANDHAAALAQTEPLHPTANRPYTVANRRYQPMKARKPHRQRGMASWYGRQFHGRRTATGERFDMHQMTAAHPTLPLPSWVRVTHAQTGESVVVRVNDRGPFAGNRIIDLSHAAAKKLGFIEDGLVAVEVELLLPGDIPETESAD